MTHSDSNGGLNTPDPDGEVGRLALESGLISRAEFDTCREHQKQSSDPNHRSISQLLVDNNYLTATQVARVRELVASKHNKIPSSLIRS